MRLTTRIVIGIVAFGFAFGGGIGIAPSAAAQSYVPTDEQRVIDMTNQTRAKKGLKKLIRHDQLVAMARGQADRMEARGNIYHNPDLSGEITRRGLAWERVGENVGMGPNVDLIYEALLDSRPHYENIVRPDYNHIGLGVVAGDDGKRYLVQVFADLKTTAAAPAPVKKAPAPVKPSAAPATKSPVAAKPAPAAPASAPAAPATAAPAVKPAPRPSTDPNAVTGGYVVPVELPRSDLGRYLASGSGSSGSGFERIVDALTFWS